MLQVEKLGSALFDPDTDMICPGQPASSSWLAPRLCPTSWAKVMADSALLAGICNVKVQASSRYHRMTTEPQNILVRVIFCSYIKKVAEQHSSTVCRTNPVVKQRRESRVPRVRALVAQRAAPGEALDAGREVSVGEDVREAEVGVVHPGELGQEDLGCRIGVEPFILYTIIQLQCCFMFSYTKLITFLALTIYSLTCCVWLHSVQKSNRIRTSFTWK